MREFVDRCPHPFRFCPPAGFNRADPILELLVGLDQDPKRVLPPGEQRVPTFVPILRNPLQHLVIGFFRLFDQAFQADITADIITCLVKEQDGQEPRDAAIPIGGGVD